jgi:hypothetical protein
LTQQGHYGGIQTLVGEVQKQTTAPGGKIFQALGYGQQLFQMGPGRLHGSGLLYQPGMQVQLIKAIRRHGLFSFYGYAISTENSENSWPVLQKGASSRSGFQLTQHRIPAKKAIWCCKSPGPVCFGLYPEPDTRPCKREIESVFYNLDRDFLPDIQCQNQNAFSAYEFDPSYSDRIVYIKAFVSQHALEMLNGRSISDFQYLRNKTMDLKSTLVSKRRCNTEM